MYFKKGCLIQCLVLRVPDKYICFWVFNILHDQVHFILNSLHGYRVKTRVHREAVIILKRLNAQQRQIVKHYYSKRLCFVFVFTVFRQVTYFWFSNQMNEWIYEWPTAGSLDEWENSDTTSGRTNNRGSSWSRKTESEPEMRATYADEDFPRRILIFHVS